MKLLNKFKNLNSMFTNIKYRNEVPVNFPSVPDGGIVLYVCCRSWTTPSRTTTTHHSRRPQSHNVLVSNVGLFQILYDD